MPSDDAVAQVLRVLAAPLERYRSAVATTFEELRGRLAARGSAAEGYAEQVRAEYGRFAEARIDTARVVAIPGEQPAVDPLALARLERASETLRAIASRKQELFCLEVPRGGDLTAAVAARLAETGRVFGAARVAQAASRGPTLSTMSDDEALASFGFPHWNSGERQLAPPLVVSVSGADLRAGGLAEFLDGSQQIVLVVDGACAPAALVRLITPGTLVIQTHETEGLERLAGWSGPAVAALLPSTAARFIHDPAAGGALWQRLKLEYLPEEPPARVDGLSVAQQAEELRQLGALAVGPTPAATGVASSVAPADPAERLAAWLLSQADLTEPKRSELT